MSSQNHPHILIATGLYPPESGGPATFTRLAEEYLTTEGFSVTVVPFSKTRSYPKIIRHFAYFFLLIQKVPQVTVVLALDPISVGVPARIVSWLFRLPFVVRLGGDYAWEQGTQRYGITCRLDDFHKQKKVPLPVAILRWLQARVVTTSDRVIAPSQYLKSIITTWGVSPDSIEVIYSVSDFSPSSTSAHETSLQVHHDSAQPVLLSISRLVPWKGFLPLIEVVASLREEYPKILLYIGGDGPQSAELDARIKELNLNEQVRLLGRLAPADMVMLSREVDMFVLNTEYEGFSHLLIEFMQLRVPIITTAVGGNPELITDRVSGRLLPVGDTEALRQAIVELTEQPALGQSYVEFASKRVTEFSEATSMARVKSVLTNLIKPAI